MEHFWWWVRFYALRLVILAAVIALSWSVIRNAIKPKGYIENKPEPEIETVISKVDIYAEASKNLSSEHKALLEDIGLGKGAVIVEVITPVNKLQKELNKGQTAYTKFISKVILLKNYITSKKNAAIAILKLFLTISFLVLVTLRFMKLWHPMRIISTLLIELSRAFIIPVSIIALIAAFGFRVNIWQTADFAFFWVPLGMLLTGSLGLWSVDDNYPVWKAMYAQLMFPIASGAGILVKSMFF